MPERQAGSKKWKLFKRNTELETCLSSSLDVSPTLCRVLINRGIASPEEAREYLSPDVSRLHDPGLLDHIDLAVNRTVRAINQRERIMVHGDYDVDGITSTALLVRVLRALGSDVTWYVPHRQREGYDLRRRGIEEAKQIGASLIITADCGTSAADEVEYARSLGIDVIVTDHHEPGGRIAEPLALVNPRKPSCRYPFKDLAGVGVAFKFAEALVRACGYNPKVFRQRFLDLVAIGTIADVVPLLGENRVFAKLGLEQISTSTKAGIRALLQTTGLEGKKITSNMLGYAIAPRLNAAGRIDSASAAIELLLTKDDAEAGRLAQILEDRNRERQHEQERITQEALQQIAGIALDKFKVLVLSSYGWNPGIVGIVATKLVDKYHRPAVLLALDENSEVGVGSARSIESFHVFDALMRCGHLLERCGGHAKAAGLSIMACRINDFQVAINQVADEVLTESDLIPQIEVDAELEPGEVTIDLARELQLLEPFGYGNREPVFVSRGAVVTDKTRVGTNGAHLKMWLLTSYGRPAECIGFGWGEMETLFRIGSAVDLCYNIRLNEFNGAQMAQMVLQDARGSDSIISDPLGGQSRFV